LSLLFVQYLFNKHLRRFASWETWNSPTPVDIPDLIGLPPLRKICLSEPGKPANGDFENEKPTLRLAFFQNEASIKRDGTGL
jgi:hypothetical protein